MFTLGALGNEDAVTISDHVERGEHACCQRLNNDFEGC